MCSNGKTQSTWLLCKQKVQAAYGCQQAWKREFLVMFDPDQDPNLTHSCNGWAQLPPSRTHVQDASLNSEFVAISFELGDVAPLQRESFPPQYLCTRVCVCVCVCVCVRVPTPNNCYQKKKMQMLQTLSHELLSHD